MKKFVSIVDFLEFFKDEEACHKYFEEIRFRDGEYCPHCGNSLIYRFADGKRYRCSHCKKDFTIKTGTIFGESKITLKKWFIAIYMLSTAKKRHIVRPVGKTGWSFSKNGLVYGSSYPQGA